MADTGETNAGRQEAIVPFGPGTAGNILQSAKGLKLALPFIKTLLGSGAVKAGRAVKAAPAAARRVAKNTKTLIKDADRGLLKGAREAETIFPPTKALNEKGAAEGLIRVMFREGAPVFLPIMAWGSVSQNQKGLDFINQRGINEIKELKSQGHLPVDFPEDPSLFNSRIDSKDRLLEIMRRNEFPALSGGRGASAIQFSPQQKAAVMELALDDRNARKIRSAEIEKANQLADVGKKKSSLLEKGKK